MFPFKVRLIYWFLQMPIPSGNDEHEHVYNI